MVWDLISGSVRRAMFRIGEGNVRRNYGDAVVQMCLQALGASSETTAEILSLSLPDIPQK